MVMKLDEVVVGVLKEDRRHPPDHDGLGSRLTVDTERLDPAGSFV